MKKIVLVGISVLSVMSIAAGVVGAQDTPATPAAPDAQTMPQPPRLGMMGGRLGQGGVLRDLLQIVADDLQMEPRDVLEALRDQSLADVIASANGDVATITADVVAVVTERVNTAVANGNLSQERADAILGNLEETVTNAINGMYRELRQGMGGGRPGMGGERPGMGGLRGGLLGDTLPLINAASDATGLTPREIGEAVRGGQTLGEVITANGADPAAVVDAALAEVSAKLDTAVTNGRITAEQESAMLGGLKAFYEAALGGAFRPAAAPDAAGML